jgi:hypothetical protein
MDPDQRGDERGDGAAKPPDILTMGAPRRRPPMKTRAAVAFEAKKPLEIVELDLEGPKAGEVLVEIMATGSATPTPIRSTGSTARAVPERPGP